MLRPTDMMRDKQDKKISIIGAYGHPNFGDQLLFQILHDWLRELRPGFDIVVPWGSVGDIVWPDGVVVGGGWRDLLRSQAIVFGGGGYLGEAHSPEQGEQPVSRLAVMRALREPWSSDRKVLRSTRSFAKYAAVSAVAAACGIPYCVIGTGVGPVTTKVGRVLVGRVLKGASHGCVRDEESLNHATQLTTKHPLQLASDMVLYLCAPPGECSRRGIGRIGVHLGPSVLHDVAAAPLGRMIEDLRKIGDVVLLTDCAPRANGAASMYEQLNSHLCTPLSVVGYEGPQNLLESIRGCDAVVTSKLHVGIAAYVSGTFPVSVAAHVKTRRFYRQVGLDGFCFDLSERGCQDAVGSLRMIAESHGEIERLLRAKRRTVFKMAALNRDILSRFCDQFLF